MKRIWNFWNNHLAKKQDGFALLEMVITIPIMAIVGGSMVFLIGQSIQQNNQNALLNKSENEISKVVNQVNKIPNCYALDKLKANPIVSEKVNGSTITTKVTINNTSGKCTVNEANTVKVTSVRTSDSKFLFETNVKVFME